MWLQCLFRTGCSNCCFVIGSISETISPDAASSTSMESFCDVPALSTSTNRWVFFTKSVYRFDVCALNFGCGSFLWSSSAYSMKPNSNIKGCLLFNAKKKWNEIHCHQFLYTWSNDSTVACLAASFTMSWPSIKPCSSLQTSFAKSLYFSFFASSVNVQF